LRKIHQETVQKHTMILHFTVSFRYFTLKDSFVSANVYPIHAVIDVVFLLLLYIFVFLLHTHKDF